MDSSVCLRLIANRQECQSLLNHRPLQSLCQVLWGLKCQEAVWGWNMFQEQHQHEQQRMLFSCLCFSMSASFKFVLFFWPCHPHQWSLGWFLFWIFSPFDLDIPASCSILFTDFRTVFVFVLRPLLPLVVKFLDFNGNFNGKMAKNRFSAIKSARNVLQPSS